jgi:predicted acetyltransferase
MDGDFCGKIHLRWQPGTADLPEHVLGHIGFMVVPWKRRQGYASAALRLILPAAAKLGLPYVEITTDPDNIASQRVITACGGVLVEHFNKPDYYDGGEALRYRINIAA